MDTFANSVDPDKMLHDGACKKTVKMYFVAPTSSGCQLHKTACQLHIFTCQPMKRKLRNDVGFAQYIPGYTVANL